MKQKMNSRMGIAIAALGLAIVACTCGLGNSLTPTEPHPTVEALPTLPPPPTKAPITGGSDLQVINTAIYPYADSGWRLIGEVVNNTPNTLSGVSLKLEWMDAAGTPLGADTAYVLVYNIAPGESAPFSYFIYDGGLAVNSFTATVAEFSATQDFTRATLDPQNIWISIDEYGSFHCTGELVNNTGGAIEISGLAAKVVDSSNTMVAAESYWTVSRHLEADEKTPFSVTLGGFDNASINDYDCALLIDAIPATSLPPAPVQFQDTNGDGDSGNDITFYVDSYGYSHLVGRVVNVGNEALSVQLVAGLYNEEGYVIAADYTSTVVALRPGEDAPFDFISFGSINYNAALRDLVSRYTVRIDPYWTYAAFSEEVNLGATLGNSTTGDGLYTQDVIVTNQEAFNVDFAYVLVTLIDANGKLVGYSYSSTDAITAGGTGTASVTIYYDPSYPIEQLLVSAIARAPKP